MTKMRILESLLLLFIVLMSCGGKPAVYTSPQAQFQPQAKLAILPFNNYSGKEDAGKQISNAFLVELLKESYFTVLEPGEVERVMRDERIRSADQIDAATARKLNEKLSADYLLIGAVNEYGYFRSGDRDIPQVGFSARILDAASGRIVWATYHSRKGDDRELIFSWRLVTSLSKLAQNSVHDVIKRMNP